MKRFLLAAVVAVLMPFSAIAQSGPPGVPSPVKPPVFIGYPVRAIATSCSATSCKIACEKGKEIIASAICNNHRTIGGPGDGPQPGPEIMAKYLDSYQAECPPAPAPGYGDSMVALCIRGDMINKIPKP